MQNHSQSVLHNARFSSGQSHCQGELRLLTRRPTNPYSYATNRAHLLQSMLCFTSHLSKYSRARFWRGSPSHDSAASDDLGDRRRFRDAPRASCFLFSLQAASCVAWWLFVKVDLSQALDVRAVSLTNPKFLPSSARSILASWWPSLPTWRS